MVGADESAPVAVEESTERRLEVVRPKVLSFQDAVARPSLVAAQSRVGTAFEQIGCDLAGMDAKGPPTRPGGRLTKGPHQGADSRRVLKVHVRSVLRQELDDRSVSVRDRLE